MIELLCVAILLVAAGFHFYWGFGGRLGWQAALPSRPDGQPAFKPRAGAAHLVGLALVAAVLLIGMHTGALPSPLPPGVARAAVGLMAAVFLVRAFGAFRHAGWFKAVRDTRFARYDTWFYCPLCLLLGAGLAWLAASPR